MRGGVLASMIAASMASAALSATRTAIAGGEGPCARVVAPDELPSEWAVAVADLKSQIAQVPPSDCQPMTLSLEPGDGGIRIVASTADGRRVERIVGDPRTLFATALGLLMTIPGEPAPPPPPTPPPPPRSPALAVAAAPPVVAPASEAATATALNIALWAGLSGGVRVTGPISLTAIDVEARADLLLGSWLMLLTLRSAVVSCLGEQGVDCDVYSDVSAGVGVGRRLRLGGPDLDVAFEPSLVAMHMEYDGASGTQGQAIEDTEVALRLDASARLALPVARHWALTVTLDGGLAPALLAKPVGLELPPGAAWGPQRPPVFPAWCGGVRLGVSGALL